MSTQKRTRNWAFIVYPDSAPENWREILSDELVPCLISPLHNADLNVTGEEKKPHWHVILIFKGVKQQSQVEEITQKLNATIPQKVNDLRSYARYLCHLDNPEKAQYSIGDVQVLGGIDYFELIASAGDEDEIIDEILDWVNEQGCYSFKRLSDYARKNRKDWQRVIRKKSTLYISTYLKSFEWEERNGLN